MFISVSCRFQIFGLFITGFSVSFVIDGLTDIDRPIIIGKGSNVILEKLLLGTVPESLSNIQAMVPDIRQQLGK